MKNKFFAARAAALLLLTAMLFTFCGCGSSKGYKEKDLNEDLQALKNGSDYLTVTSYDIDGIPAAEIYVDNGVKKPLVILLHGVMSNKEGQLELAKSYADNNMFVVVIDAVAQGERAKKFVMFPQMVVETAIDLNTVIGHYADSEQTDISRLGLVGFSMGSLEGYWYTVYGSYPVTALIAESGTPDFTQITPENMLNIRYKGIETKESNWSDEKFTEYMAGNNPLNIRDNFMRTSVFMINGMVDNLMPFNGSEDLYNYLTQVGSDVKYLLYADHGHLDLPYDEIRPLELQFLKEKLGVE